MKRAGRIVTVPERFVPAFWSEADGRCSLVKEIRRRVETLKQDTGADSSQKRTLCERVVFISLQLETMERNAVDGKGVDLGIYTQSVNALLGLLKALGLERKLKSVHDLKSYIGERRQA